MADLKTLKKLQDSLTKALTTINELITSAETPKDKEKEKESKDAKNLPRITKAISEQLQKECEKAGTWDDKFKKEFAERMNSLPKDDFAKKSVEVHMTEFAQSKNLLVGGGAEPLPDVLTYKQLKELKGLTEAGLGVFRTKQGKLVTGPAELPDETMDDGTFEGAEVLIGETTKRVYNSDEEFIGFWGIGKFKDADM
jgi:hypothetical protein